MPEREHTCCFTGYREYKLPWGSDENDPAAGSSSSRSLTPWTPSMPTASVTSSAAWPTAATCIFRRRALSAPQSPGGHDRGSHPLLRSGRPLAAELRARYDYDLRQCDYQTLVQEAYTPGCMMRRNRYMVDASRILIAAFDGRPGGTARTLEYAALRKLEIIQLPIDRAPVEL